MKKILLILLFTSFSFSQKNLICIKDDISFSIEKTDNAITINSKGLAFCQENNILTFVFENNTTFSITSWNKYNCSGLSLFNPFKKQMALFKNKLISIELTNGITKKTILYVLKEDEKDFFVAN